MFFIFPMFFIILKTLNSQCENNGNLKHLYTKLKSRSAAHKTIADYVF